MHVPQSLSFLTFYLLNFRILEERKHTNLQASSWFSPDGTLVALPDPVNPRPSRPSGIDAAEDDCSPLSVYVPAVAASLEQQMIASSALFGGAHCQLEVDIASVVFSHHHLFALEHYLTRRLMELYQDYSSRLRNNAVMLLTSRLR